MAIKTSTIAHITTPRPQGTAHWLASLGAVLLTLVALAAPASAQSDIELMRTGTRLSFGAGVVMGALDFRSDPVIVLADLGQIPSAAVGMEAWLDESAGFNIGYQFGTFGEVSVPLDVVLGNEPKIQLTYHRLEGAFLYRWFLGPKLTSMAFGFKAGFLLHNLTPSPHSPSLILSTTYFGPTLGGTARIPFTETMGLDAEAALVLPFNVREFPDDSGRSKNPLGAHAGGAFYLGLTRNLLAKVRYDLRFFNVGYNGTGTRGLGSAVGGASDDLFHSVLLQGEWILD